MEGKLWINGTWKDAADGARMNVENPATGETIGSVACASAADVDLAVQAAKIAFEDGRWSRKTPGERAAVLLKMADLVEARKDEIGRIETEDTGKPHEFLTMPGDMAFSVDNLRFFAGAARNIGGSNAGEYVPGFTSMLRSEPCGVSAGICPWNYPFMMAVWKLGPALAAGCTSIIKPAPDTPRSTLLLGEIAQEAGLPDGVLNIVTGEAGPALVAHPDIRMVSLTGSTNTGKVIMRNAADTLKRVHLELGGKAPVLVFEDADVELAAGKIALAGFLNSGQDCTAATRILVHESILKQTTEAIVAAAKAFKMGQPFAADTQIGSMISRRQLETVSGFVQRAKAQGGRILTGGATPAGFEQGCFFAPTVIDGVGQDWEIVQQEVFGPVITIQSFATEDEAVAMANDCAYGLAASTFGRDVGRTMRVASRLQFGTVWINDHLPLGSETPHGGFKQSGFGKDLSMEAVHDYQVTKHVMVSLA